MNNNNSDFTVVIRNPNKFIWSFVGITIILCNSYAWWIADMLSDLMAAIALIFIVLMAVYGFYLFYKHYSKTSVKKITVNTDDKTIITYQLLRSSDSHGGTSFDYEVSKHDIRLKIQNNKLWLLEKGKPIVKIYKDTLLDKRDWDWIIDYYKT